MDLYIVTCDKEFEEIMDNKTGGKRIKKNNLLRERKLKLDRVKNKE